MSKAADDRQQRKTALIRFLRTIQRPDRPIDDIEEDRHLTESGLIDSLAMLQIVAYLEQTYHIDFQDQGVDPGDLTSVASILELIEQKTAGQE